MSDPFDLARFRALNAEQLDEYIDAVEDSKISPPGKNETAQLLKSLREHDPVCQMFIIRCGIRHALTGIEDVVVSCYLAESDLGAQFTMLRWLEGAPNLTEAHIDQIKGNTDISSAELREAFDRQISALRAQLPKTK